MNKVLALAVSAVVLAGCQHASRTDTTPAGTGEPAATAAGAKAHEYLTELEKIGARSSSSPAEAKAADWIAGKLSGWGYTVNRQPFTYKKETDKNDDAEARENEQVQLKSQNVAVTIPGAGEGTIVVGAHYDSKGEGSQGATDNGAGVTALLAVAEALKGEKLPYTVDIVFFGAEENGLNGSKAYLAALSPRDVARIKAMVNYDTIAGGDVLYIHSALTDPAKFECENPGRYSSDPKVRNRLLALSKDSGIGPYQMHPAFPGYPEGETGAWSDHAGFACLGIPVAQVEATNFAINGEDGYDGYSQTVNPATWDCFDATTTTACNRDEETKWGKIWHTGFDRIDELDKLFGDRVANQMSDGTELTIRFLREPGL